MDPRLLILESLKVYGVGRRKLDDDLFADDKPFPRLGIYDVDDESLCHEVKKGIDAHHYNVFANIEKEPARDHVPNKTTAGFRLAIKSSSFSNVWRQSYNTNRSLKFFTAFRKKRDKVVLARNGAKHIPDELKAYYERSIKSPCNVPGCKFTADSLLDFENHYNSSHRYSCCQCKKVLPSPHLLDLHVQEKHDSFFAVLAAKKPSYCCYIEECKDKFMTADERLNHCVQVHKLPKDFRFDQKPKAVKNPKPKKKNATQTEEMMELDQPKSDFSFSNSKQKAFSKYTGRKFTKDKKEKETSSDVIMNTVLEDLKESLPK